MNNITPLGFAILFCAVILILILPRKYAALPIIFAACFLTLGQQVKIAVFHFTGLRILIFVIFVRFFLRAEFKGIIFNKVDTIFLIWVTCSVVIYTVLHGTTEALINRSGFAYNAIGIYMAIRLTIREIGDFEILIKALALIAIPLSLIMLNEYLTGRNLFSFFGGVPEYTAIRNDKLRCQGPFAHPILAGTFGATLMPFLFSLWFKNKEKVFAFIAFSSATLIVFVSSSSGPLMAYLAALLALCMWPLRNQMKLVRWGIFIAVVGLHLIMKAPVWALIGRLGNLIGGTGWHRVELIDATVAHIQEWWFMGVKKTSHWGLDTLPDNPNMIDITNQFVSEAINGGFIKLTLFVILLAFCYSTLGKALKHFDDKYTKILIWSIGATLFAHMTSFLSVAYFDQITTFWYMLLALIAALGSMITTSAHKEAPFHEINTA